jgi:NADH-quinone oxidoreductase subunit J
MNRRQTVQLAGSAAGIATGAIVAGILFEALGVAVFLLASGLALVLPGGSDLARKAGVVIGIVALVLVAAQVFGSLGFASDLVFQALAATAVVSAIGAVSMPSPVYCALWFALTLISTAGLFLFQGAQFLAVATIIVYAGAILVTFLFVLMLARPRGDAAYDRVSWQRVVSATAGAVLVGVLSAAVLAREPPPAANAAMAADAGGEPDRDQGVLHSEHVARLGGELFSRHLVAIEVAGTLLVAALVGAVAIVGRDRPISPPERATSDG